MRRGAAFAVLLLSAVAAAPAAAQGVSGQAFEDRNGNGIRDAGEPAVAGVPFRLVGRPDAGGAIDSTLPSAADGSFAFSPGNGCYLLAPADPDGWRLSAGRFDGFPQSTPGYTAPVGQPRFSKLDRGIAHLLAGPFRITAMGDSIARNFNVCTFPTAFWYTSQVRSRMACAVPTATFSVDQAAVLGEHTDDLLVDDTSNLNNVFRVMEAQPQLITLSMIGNDMLDVDPGSNPTQTQINRAVAEVLDSRQNLQEALSVMTSQVPGADIVLNSLYDNEAYNCSTGNPSLFHRTWLPIVNRILRDLAWGQVRRASVTEAAAEFAHEDQAGACTGFEGKICRDFFGFDNIHPTSDGYSIIREKLWEASGGVNLGPKDALSRTSIANADYGYLRRVRRLLPTRWEALNGASATDPAGALSDQDGGAPARIALGAGSEEFRLSGFPDWFDRFRSSG